MLHWQGLALAIDASVSDSQAAGRVWGVELPRLPAWHATTSLSGPQGGYLFDDLKLALGRTSVQGRVSFASGEPRPRVTATLSGPLVDFAELATVGSRAGVPKGGASKGGASSPTLAADVDAEIRFERVVLPDKRSLGPVRGVARLNAGTLELKQFSVAVDGASATMDGTIGDPLIPAALKLAVSVEVQRGNGVAALTGLDLSGLPAFSASAALTDLPGGYLLTGLNRCRWKP